MKYYILLTLLASQASWADNSKNMVCRSQCVGVSVEGRTLMLLGNMTKIANTKVKAWSDLVRKCKSRAFQKDLQPVLVKDSVMVSVDQSSGSSSSSFRTSSGGSYSPWYYSYYHTPWFNNYSYNRFDSAYSFQQDEFNFQLGVANASDSCSLEEVSEEDLEEIYDGDLPVFG